MSKKTELPALPLVEWEPTKIVLHLYLQIIGKVRMALMPRRNHWWNVTIYLSSTGMTTGPMPYDDGMRSVTIDLDFVNHELRVVTSDGSVTSMRLKEGTSVADFYGRLMDTLDRRGVKVTIQDRPYDMPEKRPFSQLTDYTAYDRDFVGRFWRIMLWVDGVFKEFAGGFYGKSCPVHIYWHHMDLTVTRFSGRRGPSVEGMDRVSDKDAYTHEVISFGFWAGDEMVRDPAVYGYAYPSPEGLEAKRIEPASAAWIDSNGSPMAFLPYDALRAETDPRAALLSFMRSTYDAAATLAGWDVDDLRVPELGAL